MLRGKETLLRSYYLGVFLLSIPSNRRKREKTPDSIFLYFQTSMDLPPDKAKLLKQYDDERKWDLICDQVGPYFVLFNPMHDY